MLCFDFYGSWKDSVKIHLCEETLLYHPNKERGIYLSALIALSFPKNSDRILNVIHARNLDNVRVNSLFEDNDELFHNQIYSKSTRHRCTSVSKNEVTLLLNNQDSLKNITWREYNKNPSNNLSRLNDDDIKNAPYTHLTFNNFPIEYNSFIFKFSGKIHGDSFEDLIEESNGSNLRLYKIYGPEYIHSYISSVFIPKANRKFLLKHGKELNIFNNLKELFEDFEYEQRIIPEEYGIFVVDTSDYPISPIKSFDLTDDLVNKTNEIDQSLYTDSSLFDNKNRIHWFVTKSKTESFYLQLIGPTNTYAERF